MAKAVELTQLTIDECFVYQIPPLKTGSGHRADEWGLDKPALTGVLKLVQSDDEMFLRVFESKEGDGGTGISAELSLFAECPIRLDKGNYLQQYVESVVDSSRYFVVRMEDKESNRKAYIGIGFRERQFAFDFKATLQDFERFVQRSREAERSLVVQSDETSAEESNQPAHPENMGLEGVKLKLSIGGTSSKVKSKEAPVSSNKSAPSPLLPPPPAKQASTPAESSSEVEAASRAMVPEDDWGDFEAA